MSIMNDAVKTLRVRAERITDEDAENDADTAFSLALEVLDFLSKLEDGVTNLQRGGVIKGEDEFAAWLVRKDGEIVYTEGGNENAKEALRRYRMGRGW